MSGRKAWVPSRSMVVSLAALVVALGGVAVAAIPGPDGVIHACVAKDDLVKQLGAALAPVTQAVSPKGALRVVDSGESCGPGETPLNFNQTGPPGPPAAAETGKPVVYSERTAKAKTVGSKLTTIFSAIVPAGAYEVRGDLHFAQSRPLKVDQRAECSVLGPSKRVITDSTVSETLKAGGSADATDVPIDTVLALTHDGPITVVCRDLVAAGAQAATAGAASTGAQGAAVGSPGIVSGNVIQVPIQVPVNVCGNSINVVGLLNPAFGNKCIDE